MPFKKSKNIKTKSNITWHVLTEKQLVKHENLHELFKQLWA
jgi:hypothetical protein